VAKFVFWLGPAPSPWDPVTALEQGIGGSETAAIHMSRELALLGHEVVVYADVPQATSIDADEAGERLSSVDVEWLPYRKMSAYLSCDVFVSSRQPDARMRLLPDCKQAWLWMHDVHCGPDWDNVIGMRYDRILCLSDWAKQRFCEYYPAVDVSKVAVTSNGVDASLFAPFEEPVRSVPGGFFPAHSSQYHEAGDQHFLLQVGHVPLRATFSSSPDRGLAKLLDLWPDVCNMIPRDQHRPEGLRPELHVYYGFDNWRKIAQLQGAPLHVLKQIDRLEARVRQAPCVVYHGRAGQAEVARSYMRSQLWLYPSDFEETSCCHPDTMVSLPGDHRKAQPYRVRIADLVGKKNFPVYTYDAKEDRFRLGTVLWCAQTKIASELVEIELDDGSKLRVTPDHMIMNFESQWVEAGSLEPGDRLLASLPEDLQKSIIEDTKEGRWNHRVVAVRRIPGGPVYDMEVSKYHNFVADGVVVHNCITAMEAQAAGCKVVATRCGAVPETVAGGYFVDGPTNKPGFDVRFLECVKEAICDDSVIVRQPRSWAKVARQWEKWL